jgi:hypothetical protein
MTEERWWPTIRQTFMRKTFHEMKQLQKIEGFNFLLNMGIEITSANDWEDEDVWSSSDRDQPTDDGRFQLTIEHSIALGMQFQSEYQNCVALPLRDLKPGHVIKVYYRSAAVLDKNAPKHVHYTVSSFL